MATYRKRGEKWRAEVSANGRRESASFNTKAAAQLWARKREDDLRTGSVSSDTLAEGLKKYAKEVSPTRRGRRWEELRLLKMAREITCADQPMSSITASDLADWRDTRLSEVKPGSVLREMGLLGAVFERARREWRWVRSNPVRDVRKPSSPPPRVMRISEKQAAELFAHCGYVRGQAPKSRSQLVAAAFDLALETGMRAGEIRSLTGNRVFLSQHFVRLDRSKTGAGRDVPLSEAAETILSSLDPEHPFPITGPQMDAIFRRMTRAIGAQYTFHDTRHEAITRLARRLDVRDLARIVGHSNLSQLLTYYNPTASELATRLRDG